jgi:hypothetical protein
LKKISDTCCEGRVVEFKKKMSGKINLSSES